MSTSHIQIERVSECPLIRPDMDVLNWYAVHTKARHEKSVATQLEEKRVCTFLPLLRQMRRWSDRWTKVDVPMFSCYTFVQIIHTVEERLKVLQTQGVLGFVGGERQGTPIPEEQIESLRTIIRENIPCFPHPFLREGKRVRIRGGALEGMEGTFVRHLGEKSLVVSVELLQRSVCIHVEGYDIELV